MIKTQKAIYDFHRKHNFPVGLSIVPNKGMDKIAMWILIKITLFTAKICFRYWKFTGKNKELFYRFHLMLEELGELMEEMNEGNELKICDGLSDLIYVVIGTAVAFKIPTKEIMEEVCHSNSLKQVRNPETNIRLRGAKGKGPKWCPPNFEMALKLGRIRLTEEGQTHSGGYKC